MCLACRLFAQLDLELLRGALVAGVRQIFEHKEVQLRGLAWRRWRGCTAPTTCAAVLVPCGWWLWLWMAAAAAACS